MRLTYVAMAALVGAAQVSVAARLNGWYPCGFSEYDASNAMYGDVAFECAEVEVPLCHPGICTSDKNIAVFIKRVVARSSSKAAKALWFVQGGPGASSSQMEYDMITQYELLDGKVDVYTIDHRGTGRSNFLHCDAAQAQSGGSPKGIEISMDELPYCIQDLNFQIDNQTAAYSVTSAATDLKVIIETFQADQDVFAFGYSYGTFFLERLMQLAPKPVRGFILDGVDVATTPEDPLESANSHWNKLIIGPSRRFLEYCYDDPQCPLKFHSRETVLEEVMAFYKRLDEERDSNRCAQVLMDHLDENYPSVALRSLLSSMVADVDERELVPWILAKAKRCSTEDAHALEREVPRFGKPTARRVIDRVADDNDLLFSLIVASERWAQPSPTLREQRKFYLNGPFSVSSDGSFEMYCIYHQERDPACADISHQLPKSELFAYERDQYFGRRITLPDNVGLLLFNGGLDFATPSEMGELLYSKVDGGKARAMVHFQYGSHTYGEATASDPNPRCHDSMLADFVRHDGDADAVDTSCMAHLPPLHFYTDDDDAYYYR
ncbi:TPA: hypothetical protein N0F65_008826 [Lagenidium giganteum]|uniref:AB hydrolase-1 domain-containing protein n=1 Tax=Lagenidium giganteum TaxID=4803 RepID=A0AAV2YS84_9STRA|nr:TPA: hypothetical protein N0F65_008826 [Lagenidium giganteum]